MLTPPAGGAPVSTDAAARALTASSRRQNWTVEGAFPYGCSPAIDDRGDVLVGTIGGELCALDGETGQRRWALKTGLLGGTPATGSGSIFAAAVGGEVFSATPDGGSQWQVQVPHAHFVDGPQLAGPDVVVLRSQEGNLYGLAAGDGKVLWQRPCDPPVALAPRTTAGGLVLVPHGTENRLEALDSHTGKTVWQHDLQGHPASLGSGQDAVYVVTRRTTEDGPLAHWTATVEARRPDTGDILWERAVDNKPAFLEVDLAAASSDQVLATTSEGKMLALHATDGSPAWTIDAAPSGHILSAPIAAPNGNVCAVQLGGTMHVTNAGGTPLSVGKAGDAAVSSPAAAADGSLYVVDFGGKVHGVLTPKSVARQLAEAQVDPPHPTAGTIQVGDGWILVADVRVPRHS